MKSIIVYRGKVVSDKKRGRLLGFPTANIRLHKVISEGVYASRIILDQKQYLAATFIGSSKTFGENEYKSESYILDFNKEIYGKWITVKIDKKLRGNIKFDSKTELINQIEKDVSDVRKFFGQVL